MKVEILESDHTTVFTPTIFVRSPEYAQMPKILFFSSLAHSISHFCPLEESEFLLTNNITPSERLILVRTRSFHSELYGSFTDISINSKGALGCRDCPLKKSLCRSSSIANAINNTLLINCLF